MAVSPGYTVDLANAFVMAPTPLADWLVVMPVAGAIITGALLLMLRRYPQVQAPIAIGFFVLLVAMTGLLLARTMATGTPVVMTMGRWLPPYGISFAADALGAAMALVASIVALCVAVFATASLTGSERRYGFFAFLVLMMAGVNGAFLTGDLFNLYVWFEVLLIGSFGLIVLGNSRRQLDGGVRYALLNLLATTFFLIATGYLYGLVGTLNMADIAVRVRELPQTGPIYTVTALFILAFAMKAAAFPLNFWLPASYHTPAVATSAVFAGLLTKVGAYALMRVLIMLLPGQQAAFADAVLVIAVATMITGSLGALAQSDIRRLLGYLVISGIGVILAGVGLAAASGPVVPGAATMLRGAEPALAGAILYAFHSMVVMTGLYLLAGLVGQAGGAFHMSRLAGLYGRRPLLAALALVLVFAVSGLPPFTGFWPKLLLTRAALIDGHWWLAGTVLVTGLMTTIALGRAFALIFWREPPAGAVAGRADPDPGPPANEPDVATDQAVVDRSRGSIGDYDIDAAADSTPPTRGGNLAAVAALAAATLVFGLLPMPVIAIADTATFILLDASVYVQSVLGATP